VIAVFDPVPCLVESAGTRVDADEILSADQAAELHILICAHLVAFDLVPGQVKTGRALVFWADSVLPVVTRYVVSARPSNDRNLELLDEFNEVFPEAVLIREPGFGIVDRAVNDGAYRFHESAVNV